MKLCGVCRLLLGLILLFNKGEFCRWRFSGELADHRHFIATGRKNNRVAIGMICPLPDVCGNLDINDWIHIYMRFLRQRYKEFLRMLKIISKN